jgi:hypothetical protein
MKKSRKCLFILFFLKDGILSENEYSIYLLRLSVAPQGIEPRFEGREPPGPMKWISHPPEIQQNTRRVQISYRPGYCICSYLFFAVIILLLQHV